MKTNTPQQFEIIVIREWAGSFTRPFQPYPDEHIRQHSEMVEWIEENVANPWHEQRKLFDRPRFCSPVVFRFSFADLQDATLFRLRF